MMETSAPAPLKVLVVDDIEDNLVVLAALLRRPDMQVLLAKSARDALELLLAHDIVLALIDVQMPEMDGFELAELMRGAERTRSIPIIFVTAGLRDQARVFRGYELGAVDFLFKPIDAPILRQKVDVFLELHRQRERLSDALRLNETFVAVLAHDLRTPLFAISTSVELLARSSDPMAARAATRLGTSTRRMAGLIDQLCDLSRARLGGGFALETRNHEAISLVRRVVHEVECLDPGRPITMRVPSELRVVWDEDRMAQVLANIIGNAVRHGDATRSVDISVTLVETKVIIEVRNGGAIPESAKSELFTPFKSRSAGRGRAEGLGLGLYIAQQIVLAHNGEIEVVSDADETTVRVSVPAG